MVQSLTVLVARYQPAIVGVLLVALAVDLVPGVDYPAWLVQLLSVTAAALGVSRPTEVAARLHTTARERGLVAVLGLLGYLVASTQVEGPAVEAEPADVVDVEAVEAVEEVAP